MVEPAAKPTAYIETRIVSYLTGWPSRNFRRAADQLTTRQWWDTQRGRFELLTSQLTIVEASGGDPSAAARRLDVLNARPVADAGEDVGPLASALVDAAAIPAVAERDALHVAIAATNGIDYLLTWNCTHLANAELRDKIVQVCADMGFRAPVITTPHDLFDEATDEHGDGESG